VSLRKLCARFAAQPAPRRLVGILRALYRPSCAARAVSLRNSSSLPAGETSVLT
jgi:hypothetical protein